MDVLDDDGDDDGEYRLRFLTAPYTRKKAGQPPAQLPQSQNNGKDEAAEDVRDETLTL